MQRVTRRVSVVAGLILLALVAAPRTASAGTISIDTKFQGSSVGYFIAGDFFAQQIGSVTMSNPQGLGLDPASSFETYCVDILTDIFQATNPTANVPVTVTADAAPMSTWVDPSGLNQHGPNAGSKAAWLYEQFAATSVTNDQRSALAMAIWNVLYDTDASVSDGQGSFYVWCDSSVPGSFCNPINDVGFHTVDGAIVTLANSYLTDVTAAFLLGVPATSATWLQLSTPGSTPADIQDFVGPGPSTSTPVAEPSALLMLGLGLAAAFGARQRAHA